MFYCVDTVPQDEEPTLYIASKNALNRIYLNGTLHSNYSIQSSVFSLMFDHRNKTICFIKTTELPANRDINCADVNDFSHSWVLRSSRLFSLNGESNFSFVICSK